MLVFLHDNNSKTIGFYLFVLSSETKIIIKSLWLNFFLIKNPKQKLVFMKTISCELTFFLTKKSLTSVSCSWVIKQRTLQAKVIVTRIMSFSLVWHLYQTRSFCGQPVGQSFNRKYRGKDGKFNIASPTPLSLLMRKCEFLATGSCVSLKNRVHKTI